jgi:tetratricopeptide (TPR) repeat protein
VLIPAELEVDARVDLAAVHLLLGESDAAQALLEATRTEAPDHSLLLARLAACYVQHQREEEAIPLYECSLRLQPRIDVYQQLLRLYLQSEALHQAEETLAPQTASGQASGSTGPHSRWRCTISNCAACVWSCGWPVATSPALMPGWTHAMLNWLRTITAAC